VRTRVIILGALGALALATLSANAGLTTPRAQGHVASPVAATATVANADRDGAAVVGAKATTPKESPEALSKPVVAVKPAAPKVIGVTPACQQALNSLKALHQADLTEDAAERTGVQPLSASALLADRAEDMAEAQQWRNALTAARTACLPQPNATCQAAIAALQTLVLANRTQEMGEWTDLRNVNWPAALTTLRTAFGAVATACGDRD
jgi:hypothetical protein